jgi:hypothetical protein
MPQNATKASAHDVGGLTIHGQTNKQTDPNWTDRQTQTQGEVHEVGYLWENKVRRSWGFTLWRLVELYGYWEYSDLI